jgi:ubiquinone/menaquinone biosynthesis C-methylase UbiE
VALAHHDLTFDTSAGYAWGQLPEGSLIVDVGGGLGSQSLLLAKYHPQLRFVVQDREAAIRDTVEVCVL